MVAMTVKILTMLSPVPDSAKSIDDLLAKAHAQDEEVEALAKKAKYAGDEDPYVKPREASDED